MDFELIKYDTYNFTLDIPRESIDGAEHTVMHLLQALNIFEHVSLNEFAVYGEFSSPDSYEEELIRITEILALIKKLLLLS